MIQPALWLRNFPRYRIFIYLYIGNNDNFLGYVGGSPYLGGRV